MITAGKTLPWKISLDKFTPADHPTTIERTLSSINNDRLFITIVSGLYRSGETVLTGLDAKNLLIDKPLDWQESISSAQIYFRDGFKVWNFFRSRIVCSTHDTIYTTIPDKIHRLQRRQYFRVAPPIGCRASFRQEEQQFDSAVVNDISAGGMMISTDAKGIFPDEQVELSGIMIKIPTNPNGSGTHMFLPIIKGGEIVRSFTDGFTKRTYFGISFKEDNEVKDEISKYVMQREQEILRQNLGSARIA